jgi:hypothetical protein
VGYVVRAAELVDLRPSDIVITIQQPQLQAASAVHAGSQLATSTAAKTR